MNTGIFAHLYGTLKVEVNLRDYPSGEEYFVVKIEDESGGDIRMFLDRVQLIALKNAIIGGYNEPT